jgi:hypothetical protein
MLELKRIYWTRQLLRLAMAALTVWIFAAVILLSSEFLTRISTILAAFGLPGRQEAAR